MSRGVPRHIPQNADPLVQLIFAEMMAKQLHCKDVAKRAGITTSSLDYAWLYKGVSPTIGNLRAVLEVLGFELGVVRKGAENARNCVSDRSLSLGSGRSTSAGFGLSPSLAWSTGDAAWREIAMALEAQHEA